MKTYFYVEICLFLFCTIISCGTQIGVRITSGKTATLYRQIQRIDKLLRQDCPGSKVQEYLGNAGEVTVLAAINIFESTASWGPINARAFKGLPKIWNKGDPNLESVAARIAEYLYERMDLPPAGYLVIRLDNDRTSKSYFSFYQVTEEQQYNNGVGSHINLETGQNAIHDFLKLEQTDLLPYLPETNVAKSSH
jgi:hypothetical protein